jgi:predicted nucleic acid-binding protein
VALIVDTGPLYAALDKDEPDHTACRTLLDSFSEPLVVPSPVLVEVEYLIRTRLHTAIGLALLDDLLAGAFLVEDLTQADYRRVRQIYADYSDADVGLVDACVLAVAERLNEPKVATLDHRNFHTLRPRHVDSLILLPE